MLVLFKAEEGWKMIAQEYLTYFEDCIFPSDIKECEAFALCKGIGQKRAFIDTLQRRKSKPWRAWMPGRRRGLLVFYFGEPEIVAVKLIPCS